MFTVTSVLLFVGVDDVGELCGDVTGLCCGAEGGPCVTTFGAPGWSNGATPSPVGAVRDGRKDKT